MKIRSAAVWMQQIDERILEYVELEGWSKPALMAERPEIRYASEARLRERVTMLVDAEVLAAIHRDTVELTRWGQLYLEGEIDAAHQPRPTKSIPKISG